MRLYLFLLFCFISFFAWSQNIKFKNYTTNQGLSNNSVIDIENDTDGGLWIATWDGLNYFDGADFVVFKHSIDNKESISGNYIIKIEKDNDGVIWILTKNGKVSKYLGNNRFKNFVFDKEVTNIKISEEGNVVVFTSTMVWEFIENHFVKKKTPAIDVDNAIVFKNILLAKYPKLIINDVLKDKKGNIWFATRRNGLYIIPNNSNNIQNTQIDHYTVDMYSPYTFGSNEIEKLHLDSFNNVWLGQKDGGLSMAYQGSEFISYVGPHPNKYPHLPTETIRAITKDFKGCLWLGYYNNGAYYYDNNTKCYQKYKIKESDQNIDWQRVRSLFTASDGTIWIGTYAGIIRVFKDKYLLYKAEDIKELPNNRSYSIYEDNNHNLWISCWGGVAKFNLNKNKFESFNGQEKLQTYHVRNVKKVNSELILSTENNGLVLFNLKTSKVESVTLSNGILGNSIYASIYDEEHQNYWIASLGGISVYNKAKGLVKNITEENGLLSHMVYGLLKQDDKVWLSTTKGLVVVNKNSFKLNAINPVEGWQASEFSEGAYYKDPKGILYFGGVNGLNYFSPNMFSVTNQIPKINIEVNENENYKDSLSCSHSNNYLKINVKTIVFPESYKSEFKVFYRLKGIDDDWMLLPKSQKVIYNNLPSGNYEFLIKTSANELEQKYFTVQINKAFYETAWFNIMSIFLLALVLIFIFYVKDKNAKKQKVKLEQKIINRTKVIETQKQDLLLVNKKLDEKNKEIYKQQEKLLELHSSLKNEDFELEKFKTFILSDFQEPITKIIQQANKIKGDTVVQQKLLKNAVMLINMLSEWNYLDHVKDIGNQQKSTINLFPVLTDIVEKTRETLQKNNVHFITEIDKNIHWVEVDLLRFKLLLQYFFNDVIKYSNKQSSLKVVISHAKNVFKFCLSSNSDLLINNWNNISHYSPYHKSVKTLLSHLNGSIKKIEDEEFKIEIFLPMNSVKNDKDYQVKTISWKHLNTSQILNNSHYNVLVFSDPKNVEITKHLLSGEQSNLFFESSVSDLSSALQQINIDVVVFYQTTFTKELVSFFNLRKQDIKNSNIPFVYISEEINYMLNEQSLEFGIDVVIQLPASDSFVKKKIYALLKPKKEKQESKLQKEIYEILVEDNNQQTPNDKLLKKALEVIKNQLANPSFNVEMLIDHLGISRVKCYRLFKEVLQQSPSDVITSLRFQKAEYLLMNKKLNISEISFECGFNDPKYFGKTFKKQFGVSPKVYKEQNLKK
ncbi:two-component regulator propeller domain-containing protein [Wenyingzhuangia sp. IMCC45467]